MMKMLMFGSVVAFGLTACGGDGTEGEVGVVAAPLVSCGAIRGAITYNPDLAGRSPACFQCPVGTSVVGIEYADLNSSTWGGLSDSADGLTILCGGSYVDWNPDLAANPRTRIVSTCPGSRPNGVTYKDRSDDADGFVLHCANGWWYQPGDLTANSRSYAHMLCPSGKLMIGVAYADIGGSDAADAASPICL